MQSLSSGTSLSSDSGSSSRMIVAGGVKLASPGDLGSQVNPHARTDPRRAHQLGFAIARKLDGDIYLHEIDVHPDHGRRGLGRRLIDAVIDKRIQPAK